jgi:hypothetical protein
VPKISSLSCRIEQLGYKTFSGKKLTNFISIKGDAELIVPFWTQISAKLFALFPGLNSTLLGWANVA